MYATAYSRSHINLSSLWILIWSSFLWKGNWLLNIKVSGPRVQTFCIEKDSHMNAISCVNDAFLFQNKENKILFGPPQKEKKRKDTNGHNIATCTYDCLYQHPVTWILTWSH